MKLTIIPTSQIGTACSVTLSVTPETVTARVYCTAPRQADSLPTASALVVSVNLQPSGATYTFYGLKNIVEEWMRNNSTSYAAVLLQFSYTYRDEYGRLLSSTQDAVNIIAEMQLTLF